MQFDSSKESVDLDPKTIDAMNADLKLWQPLRDRFVRPRADSEWRHEIVDFRHMARLIDIAQPTEVLSHRPIVGSLIVFAKRSAMKLARPLIKVLLRRQIELNEHLYHCALINAAMASRIEALEFKVGMLEGKLILQTHDLGKGS